MNVKDRTFQRPDELRLATPEEIKNLGIASLGLNETSAVWALGHAAAADFAVIRSVVEVDPVIFAPSTNDRRKVIFIRDIQTALRAQSVARYYFNVHASNATWLSVVREWGAEELSLEPEIRFVKEL